MQPADWTLASGSKANFSDTTDASALGTASTVLSGGLSVAKSIIAGSTINTTLAGLSGNNIPAITAYQSALPSGAGPSIIVGVAGSTNNSAGLQFNYAGGAGSATNYAALSLYNSSNGIRVNASGASVVGTFAADGVSSFTNTTDASALGTASVVLGGGLSVAKKFYLGTGFVMTDNNTLVLGSSGGENSIRSNTPTLAGIYFKTAGTDRALISANGNLLVGGTSESGLSGGGGSRTFSTTDATAIGSASVVHDGGLSVAKKALVGNDLRVGNGTGGGSIFIDNSPTIAADSTLNFRTATYNSRAIYLQESTGKLILDGSGGLVEVRSTSSGFTVGVTTEATAAGAGAVATSGGIFAAKSSVAQRYITNPATTTYAATTNLDCANGLQTVSLTGDVTFTTSNLVAGANIIVRVICDGTPRNFTFPGGWTFVGAAAPASIAAGKTALLTLRSFGTADSAVIAQYAVQP